MLCMFSVFGIHIVPLSYLKLDLFSYWFYLVYNIHSRKTTNFYLNLFSMNQTNYLNGELLRLKNCNVYLRLLILYFKARNKITGRHVICCVNFFIKCHDSPWLTSTAQKTFPFPISYTFPSISVSLFLFSAFYILLSLSLSLFSFYGFYFFHLNLNNTSFRTFSTPIHRGD